MTRNWEDRGNYNRGWNEQERGRYSRGRERDWSDRAGDEVRSWLGDDDAERRRMEDERRQGGRDYGSSYAGGYRDDEGTYGGYGGYADRGMGVGTGYSGASGRPWSSGGYGREDSYRGRGSFESDFMGSGYGEGGSRFDRGRGYSGYGSGRYSGSNYGYGRNEERGFLDRAGDEVASWFGDEDAERRREMDARHKGRGPKNYTRSDDRIREDVNDRLSDDPHIDASDIDVTVSGGEVTLNGTVAERFAKRHAEDLAERVSGVKHVQNNLRMSDQNTRSSTPGMTTGASTMGATSGGRTNTSGSTGSTGTRTSK